MFYISVTTDTNERLYISMRNSVVSLTPNFDEACMFTTYLAAHEMLQHLAKTRALGESITYFEICTRHIMPDKYYVALNPGTKCKKLYIISIDGNNIYTSTVPGNPVPKDEAELIAKHVRDLTFADVFLVKA